MRNRLLHRMASTIAMALVAVASGALGASRGYEDRATTQHAQEPASLNLRVRFANVSGSVGGVTGVTGPALEGGEAVLMLGTSGGGDLCGSQGQFAVSGSGALPATVAGTHVWLVRAHADRVDLDRVTFDVELARYRRGTGGYELVLQETRTLTLREEQWVPVDAVTVTPEQRGSCGVAAAVLEASAEFAESVANPSHAVDYELWLVGRNSTSIEPQRRLGTRAAGEVWEFAFGMIEEPAGDCIARTTVSGTIRARVLDNGQLEVLMAPARWIVQQLKPERGLGSPDEDAGRKIARVQSGVAVEFRLPPIPAAVRDWDQWEPCGATAGSPSLFKRQLASQSLSLILKVSAAPGSDPLARN